MKLQVDSPVILAGIKVSNLLILNLFWVIGCLPLVTAGASTIAACTVALKMVENREGPGMTVQFWQAFVGNLKHGDSPDADLWFWNLRGLDQLSVF